MDGLAKNLPLLAVAQFLAVVIPAEALGAPAAPSVEALMKDFSSLRGFEARFVEKKTMASILAIPLVTEGRLYFSAPGRLLRVVEKPRPARVLVTPAEVLMRSGGATQRIRLSDRPEVRSLVSSLLSLFTGNLAALKTTYTVDYEVLADERWRLELVPRSPRLSALIEGMRFEGRGRSVDRIIVEDASGDRTVTEISDADPKRRFSDEERMRLFEGW